MKRNLRIRCALALTLCLGLRAHAQGTAFTYQGELTVDGHTATGLYDLRFALYGTETGGTEIGAVTNAAQAVTNGLFTAQLDFGGGVFNGATYWLELGVRTNDGGSFTTLSQRQSVLPAPYAMHSSNAVVALFATTAATATTSGSFTGSLAGDVTGTQGATVVSQIGGVTPSSANAANAVVKRDAAGDFSAGTITAMLNGTATGFSGPLAGDVTGIQNATIVGSVGGVAAANVASGASAANASTSANLPDTIVKRDGSGNLAAGAVTALSFSGDGAGLTNVAGVTANDYLFAYRTNDFSFAPLTWVSVPISVNGPTNGWSHPENTDTISITLPAPAVFQIDSAAMGWGNGGGSWWLYTRCLLDGAAVPASVALGGSPGLPSYSLIGRSFLLSVGPGAHTLRFQVYSSGGVALQNNPDPQFRAPTFSVTIVRIK